VVDCCGRGGRVSRLSFFWIMAGMPAGFWRARGQGLSPQPPPKELFSPRWLFLSPMIASPYLAVVEPSLLLGGLTATPIATQAQPTLGSSGSVPALHALIAY
jgi:hypothetical protein